MGFSTGAGKLLLVLIFTLGYLGTWNNGFKNGFFGKLEALVDENLPKLPGSEIHLQLDWTGIPRINRLAGTVVAFFYPVFNGQLPKLTVMGLHFYGQLIACMSFYLFFLGASRATEF